MEIETAVAAQKIVSKDPDSVIGGSGSEPQENQDGASEVRISDGASAADAVVRERNMETETVVAALKILPEDPDPVIRGSGSEPQEKQDGASEVKNGDGASDADAAISGQNMEIETVVETTFDEEKENHDVESLTVPCTSSSVEVNGVGIGVDADDSKEELVSGENNEFLEDSFAENGEGKSTDYMDVDGHEDGEEGTNDKLKDSENVFQVGDFVWAKIRSHPWWPGQVYDSKDASEFAMKRKQEGRLLVAFFGDGTCSWCLPSQLIPFVENFSEMSKDSSSKSFLNAVEKALDEVGRLVESEMICKCISKESRDVLARPVVENAGLKTGVVVPEIDAVRLSLPKFETKEVLDEVMQLAKTVSIDSALNLVIMKCLLSSFYYYKGGYQLPVYHDPIYIEGLEDKNKNVNEAGNDFSVPIEVPILGPQEDDSFSSPAVGSVEVSHRKQKSVAELMGENKNIKRKSRKRGSVKEGADSEKSLSQKKKNPYSVKDGADSEKSLSQKKKNPYSVKEGADSEKSLSQKKKNPYSVKEGADSEKSLSQKKKNSYSVKEGADSEKSSSQKKKKTKNDGEVGSGGASSTGKKGRKRKVEEILESPKSTNVKDSNAETSGLGGANGVNGRPLKRKRKGIEVAVAENDSGEPKEEVEIVSSPRERKKSKYLSPPYTNVAWRMGISSPRTGPQVEHDKTTKITQVGERQEEAMEDTFASLPISKSVEDASQGKLSNGKLERLIASEDKSPDAVKNDKELSFPVSDVDVLVNELLSDIELASRDPLYLTKKGSLEKVCAFASALRSSTNLHGENYEIYGEGKAVGEQEPVLSQLGKDRSKTKAKSSIVSKTEKRSNTSNSKKAAETSVGGSTMDTAEGTASSCLILQFATGFPLPSKKDIVKLFEKFGSINKKETKVDKDSHLIRVVYVNDSDAEAALKSSINKSPFASESVNYRLQRSSPIPKKRRSRPSRPNVSSPSKRSTGDLVSDFYTIRQKLEITTAIVENYHGKFSGEDRSSLKDEMKHLMEEVETISEKVRVMAEKPSS
ncbi:hypothetical protein ACS0TY_005803 [Phlomoides rotata]